VFDAEELALDLHLVAARARHDYPELPVYGAAGVCCETLEIRSKRSTANQRQAPAPSEGAADR
jgi:hypothetical protein